MLLDQRQQAELYDAFYDANEDVTIGVVLLSAEGTIN
jgi:1,4-dihydroxy-2-naphthoyl-CoA synthase